MSKHTTLRWVAGIAALGLVGPSSSRPSADAGAEPPRAGYTTSRPCVMCHPDHDASWRRTHHRTMTQDATALSVLGDFSGTTAAFEGGSARFSEEGGRYVMETLDPTTGRMAAFPVVRTIGSRRVQQYATKIADRHVRLPFAWNIEERRWFHLNGGFLHPDGASFHAHTSLWDGNCIFCHNTGPSPGYDRQRGTYESRVVELGIACEACHGPGAEHVARNENPLRRYLLYATDERDPTISSPSRLDKTRSVQVCGRCHGQRLPNPPERIFELLEEGDPFTPGEDLGRYTRPIFRDSKLEGVDLSKRFWADGTPRLSAYEYQGLLLSADHREGELTCISCHEMHGGDPRGMITPEKRGPAACAPCHAELVADAARHARHRPGSTGADCYACHMPKIVYGLLAVHPTHRIQSPDPSRAWRFEMPEACTLCHLDRSARWAAEALAEGLGRPVPEDAAAQSPVAETVRALLAGDVVQRAVAIMALAEQRSYSEDAIARLWVIPFLLIGMEDGYPALRHFAYRAVVRLLARAGERDPRILSALRAAPAFDPQGPAGDRARVIAALRSTWASLDKRAIPHPGASVPLDGALLPDPAVVAELVVRRSNDVIAIGE